MVTLSLDRTVQSRHTHEKSWNVTRGDYLQEHFDTLCDSFHDQHTWKERAIEQFAVTQYILFQKWLVIPVTPSESSFVRVSILYCLPTVDYCSVSLFFNRFNVTGPRKKNRAKRARAWSTKRWGWVHFFHDSLRPFNDRIKIRENRALR